VGIPKLGFFQALLIRF